MEITFQKIGIFYNPRKRDAKKGIEIIKEWAIKKNYEILIDNDDVDLGIAIGGDGTVLYALQRVASKGLPIAGINTGRLGFLTTVEFKDIGKFLNSLDEKKFFIEQHPVIKLKIDEKIFYAFNEVVFLKSENTPLISLSLLINGALLNTQPADGVIIATSAGSTAYALSAGGPIIFPDLEAFEFLPICAHSLISRPVVFPINSEIQISLSKRSIQVQVWVDGKKVDLIGNKQKVVITKAEFYGKLIFLPGWDFINRLKKKLHWR